MTSKKTPTKSIGRGGITRKPLPPPVFAVSFLAISLAESWEFYWIMEMNLTPRLFSYAHK
jgi:hypothetical protein